MFLKTVTAQLYKGSLYPQVVRGFWDVSSTRGQQLSLVQERPNQSFLLRNVSFYFVGFKFLAFSAPGDLQNKLDCNVFYNL